MQKYLLDNRLRKGHAVALAKFQNSRPSTAAADGAWMPQDIIHMHGPILVSHIQGSEFWPAPTSSRCICCITVEVISPGECGRQINDPSVIYWAESYSLLLRLPRQSCLLIGSCSSSRSCIMRNQDTCLHWRQVMWWRAISWFCYCINYWEKYATSECSCMRSRL